MKTTNKIKNQTLKLNSNFQILKNQNSENFQYILKNKNNLFDLYSKNLENSTNWLFKKTIKKNWENTKHKHIFKLDSNFQIIDLNSENFQYIITKNQFNYFKLYSKNLENSTKWLFKKTIKKNWENTKHKHIFKLNSNFKIIDLNSEKFQYILIKEWNWFKLYSKNLENSTKFLFEETENLENTKQEYIFKLDSNFQIIDLNSENFQYILIQDIDNNYILYSKNLENSTYNLFKETISKNWRNTKHKHIFKLNSNFKKLKDQNSNNFQYILIKYYTNDFEIYLKNLKRYTKWNEIQKNLKKLKKLWK